MGKKERRKKRDAGKHKTAKSTKEERRDKNRGRPAGPKLDGRTRIAGLGECYDFTRGRSSCISTWDSLTKQEQYDLINVSQDDIKRAIDSEIGNSFQMVKKPDAEEIRMYQAAFLQSMAPNYFANEDRGKIELPADPSINNVLIFVAFADRLILWDTCRTASHTFFYTLLFLILNMTHIAVSSILIALLLYLSMSKLQECKLLRKWYVDQSNRICIYEFGESFPVSWKIELTINSIVATFVTMLKFRYGSLYYSLIFCCLQTTIPICLLHLSSSDPKSFKNLRTIFTIINHGILTLYSWNESITLFFTVYIFFPHLSFVGFRLYLGCVAVAMSYTVRGLHAIAPKTWASKCKQWLEKENTYNMYIAISALHLVLIMLYAKIWSWPYLPFGTIFRSFLIMISLNSIPLTEVLTLAITFVDIAIRFIGTRFEKHVVLRFNLNVQVYNAVVLCKKKMTVLISKSILFLKEVVKSP